MGSVCSLPFSLHVELLTASFSLRSGARRAHLGRRPGTEQTKPAVLKRSAKRREIMFGDDPAAARTPLAALQQANVGWNDKRHEADLQWVCIPPCSGYSMLLIPLTQADRITTRYPYYPEEKRLELAANDAKSIPSMVYLIFDVIFALF